MAIALRNVTNVDQAGAVSASIVISKPTATADGDVLYAVIQADLASTITAPSGWTLLDSRTQTSGQKASVYRKVASGEGASWTWSVGSGGIYVGHVSSWTGVDTTTVTDGATGTNGNSTAASAPTLTPASASDDVSVVGFTTWNSTATSLPTGYTNTAAFGSNGSLVRVAYKQLASNGATGSVGCTLTTASQWTGQHVLFLTAGGGGGGGGNPRLGDMNTGFF